MLNRMYKRKLKLKKNSTANASQALSKDIPICKAIYQLKKNFPNKQIPSKYEQEEKTCAVYFDSCSKLANYEKTSPNNIPKKYLAIKSICQKIETDNKF